MTKKSIAGMLAMLGAFGKGFNHNPIIPTKTEKYAMGKDTRQPKQRWTKPIYGNYLDKIGKGYIVKGKIGVLIKFVDGSFEERIYA